MSAKIPKVVIPAGWRKLRKGAAAIPGDRAWVRVRANRWEWQELAGHTTVGDFLVFIRRKPKSAAKAKGGEGLDSAMLDWLISREAYIAHARDGECCWVRYRWGKDGMGEDETVGRKTYNSGREAITAAIKIEARAASATAGRKTP